MSSSEKFPRRRLTVNEKLAILDEYERTEMGQRGALCRRMRVDPSMVSRWRRQRRDGLLAPSDKKETPLVLTRAERVEFEGQRQVIADLESRLAQSESAVEVLGKASALLEALAKSAQAKTPQQEEEPPGPPAWGQRYVR
jgi:transposase-like protein